MKLTMLGTGSAMVNRCYNTCFVLREGDRAFLVDGGGGNQIIDQLGKANIPWQSIRDLFVTHKHMDHILGVLWMIRLFCQNMAAGSFHEEVRVYGNRASIAMLEYLTQQMLVPEQICFVGIKVQLIPVSDGERRQILGRDVTFFDICSEKEPQFGFTMDLSSGGRLTCCGDEPISPQCQSYIRGSRWLLAEAFCLYAHREIFQPYHKHHSTVKEACENAQAMKAENLLLYHTEDQNLPTRKEAYAREGKTWFDGRIWVPEDLETIELDGVPKALT